MPILLLPEVGVGIVAIVAVMMLLAYEPFRRWMTQLISRLPIIGAKVGNIIDALLTEAWNAMRHFVDSASVPFAAVLTALWAPTFYLIDGTIKAFESVYGALDRLFTGVIPAVVAWVDNGIVALEQRIAADITHAADAVVSWATDQLRTVDRYVSAALAWTEATIASTVRAVEAWVTDEIASLYHALTGIITATAHVIDAYVAAVAGWAASQLAAVASWAASSIAAAVSWTTSELASMEQWVASSLAQLWATVWSTVSEMVTAALRPLWGAIYTPTNSAVQSLSTEYPDVASQLRSLPAEVPATLQEALAALGAATIASSTFMERCGIPTCEGLGGLPKQLGELRTLLEGGLFLAFLVDAIEHPEQAAQAAETVIRDAVTPVYDVVKALVG